MESRCRELVEQLQVAPLAAGENDPERGEAVDGKWEHNYGHAHAALRYGVTTFQRPSDALPEPEPSTPEEVRAKYFERLQGHVRDKAARRQEQLEETFTYW
jgi:hypothetical protein